MSSNSVVLNTGRQMTVNTDLTKIFVWNNRYENMPFEYDNDTYDDVTIPAGTLMGRIGATQKVVPLESGASDGSEYPVGVLAQDVVILAGDEFDGTVSVCVAGDVNESKVIFDGSDDMDTLVSDRSLRDRIAADTVGIKLVVSDELTGTDNQ
jgi:hypothetical protein